MVHAPLGRERVGSALWCEVASWLIQEAEFLDEGRLDEWLEMMSREVLYEIPHRTDGGPGGEGRSFHLSEDYSSLSVRIRRASSPHAWAEDPPGLARRYVTNIRVDQQADQVRARSYVLLTKSYRGDRAPEIVGGDRHDEFTREDGALVLRRRCVVLDRVVLSGHNFGSLL